MWFKHSWGSRDVTPTEYQDSGKPLTIQSLQFLCERQNLALLATSQEAEGRADYQQTDTTSISTKLAQMAAVSMKWGQLHRRWGLG
jgi:hypothetical protein